MNGVKTGRNPTRELKTAQNDTAANPLAVAPTKRE